MNYETETNKVLETSKTMSEEIKMSDVWPSPFSVMDFTYGYYDNAETVSGEMFKATDSKLLCGLLFTNEEPANAMMHAINSHDGLIEEVETLRKEKAGLVEQNKHLRETLAKIESDAGFYLNCASDKATAKYGLSKVRRLAKQLLENMK